MSSKLYKFFKTLRILCKVFEEKVNLGQNLTLNRQNPKNALEESQNHKFFWKTFLNAGRMIEFSIK